MGTYASSTVWLAFFIFLSLLDLHLNILSIKVFLDDNYLFYLPLHFIVLFQNVEN